MPNKNILLISTDEQRYDALGCNGNPDVLTPHLDRLARQSVRFTEHRCSVPVCTPARFSMLTGLYARSHGAWHVGVKAPEDIRGLSHWLRDAGFGTGLFGKAHFEGEFTRNAERLKVGDPYYGFTHHGITEDRPDGPYIEWIKQNHPQYLRDVLNDSHEECRPDPWPACEDGGLVEGYVSDTPEHLRQTAWITDRSIDFMKQMRRETKPFFAWCSYVSPHHPWNPPRAFAEKYDPSRLPVPSRTVGAHGGLRNIYCFRESMSDSEMRRMVALYYAMVSHIDHHVGRILAWLDEQSLLEDTIILFTSDHGDYNGQYGMIRKNALLYDCLLRVPMMVRLPGQARAGSVYTQPTQHEDLAPTIMEWLGMTPPKTVQGISFADAVVNGTSGQRKDSYFESYWGDGTHAAGVARQGWKLAHYANPSARVLTHLDEDPDEMQNLAEHRDCSDRMNELQSALISWQLRTPAFRLPKIVKW